jgi:membrane fusion protein (multidrug efflux system)
VPEAGQQFVYRVQAAGAEGQPARAVRVAVQTGLRLPGEVQVTGGLARGDRVVTAGVLKIRDGTPVQVAPPGGGGAGAGAPVAAADPAPAG